MLKFLLTITFLFSSVACAWADDLAMASTVDPSVHTILGGVVKSVSWSDPSKSNKSEIVVVNALKKPVNIYIAPTTTVWDEDAKAVMPDKIAAKNKLNVYYFITPEGINIAKSIKILN